MSLVHVSSSTSRFSTEIVYGDGAREKTVMGRGEEEFRGMFKWLEGGNNIFLSKKLGHI